MKKMKRAAVYLLCFTMLFALLLSGNGGIMKAKGGISSDTEEFAGALVEDGLIADERFAQAIAESILADTDNFDYGDKTIADYGTYEEVLNHYTGDIKASKRGIKDITGFIHIRQANSVDLSYNEITDVRPMVSPTAQERKLYYGKIERPYKNMKIDIDYNPIFHFPSYIGGLLEFNSQGTHAPTGSCILSGKEFRYVSSGEAESFNAYITGFAPTFDGELGTVNSNVGTTAFLDRLEVVGDKEFSLTLPPTGGNEAVGIKRNDTDYTFSLQNLQTTGGGIFATALVEKEQILYGNTPEGSTFSGLGYSIAWEIPVAVEIYNSITYQSNTDYVITFTKLDENDQPLAGAVYGLYETTAEKEDTLIGKYTTDENGTFTVPDEDVTGKGSLYFKELSAPAGYQVNPEKVEVNTTDIAGSFQITSDTGNTITANDGIQQKEETLEQGVYALGGVDLEGNSNEKVGLKIEEPRNGKLKEVKITRTAGRSLEQEETKVFSKEEMGSEGLAYIQEAIDDYANVEVEAVYQEEIQVSQSDEPNVPEEPEEPQKPETPQNPENPQEPETPGEPENPQEPGSPETPNEPETGAESHIVMWSVLMGMAIAGVGILAVRRKGQSMKK